ncbi:hypothetical protein GCM10027259_39940 [Micromonospora palomenae]
MLPSPQAVRHPLPRDPRRWPATPAPPPPRTAPLARFPRVYVRRPSGTRPRPCGAFVATIRFEPMTEARYARYPERAEVDWP